MALHLMRPEWLWSLVPALLLAIFLWRHRDRLGSWNQVISSELLPFLVSPQGGSRGPNLLPLIVLGWVLAGLAASGPSWQKLPLPVHQKQDALVLVMDLSYSMKSGDLAPSRLDRARQKLLDLLAMRKEGQTGLIAYAGDAHIVTPLTDDTQTIANLLPALNPDMMPVPGSDPASAVTQAIDLLHSAGIRNGKVVLLTDGISTSDSKAITKAMSKSGASLAIVGIGTATGAPIPMPRGGFLKDRDGTIVMPGLDEQPLRQLANESGGHYLPIQIDNSDLDILLAESPLTGLEPTLALDRTADSWDDQGYLLILPLLPLVLALFRRGWILCLLPLLFIAQPRQVYAAPWDDLWLTPDQQGQRSLEQGDSEAAAEIFKDPAWAATASYEAGDYEAAAERFSHTDDADSWYNRGNALARSGKLDEAIKAYQESLQRAPDRADAQENLELLEQLKQQQQQQQQDSQDQQQDQEQQEQEENQQQENQDQSGQQDQDQQQQQTQQDQGQQDNQQRDNARQDDNQQAQNSSEEQQQEQEQAQEQQQEESDQATEEQNQQEQAQEEQAQESDPGEQEAKADSETQERDQAVEQWLRRVPDDPSGLLREKFRYESYQRQQQGAQKDNDTYW